MKGDGEAVLQSLTAVWRGMRYLRECDEKGNDLEEVKRVVRKGLCYGSTTFGVVVLVMVDSAGAASRHAAVTIVGRFYRSAAWRGVCPMRDERIQKGRVCQNLIL